MELFLEQVINGLNAGSIYALIAIGYTMVYGIIRLINFAHGEIMMFGAYFAFLIATALPVSLPFFIIVIVSMLLAALMGVLTEKIAYKKLRRLRSEEFSKLNKMDSLKLTEGLSDYSTLGNGDYAKRLNEVITFNKLQQYDD